MQNIILKQARAIAHSGDAIDIEQAQQLLMNHLTINQYDTEAWLLLARLECNPPFYDQDRIIHYVQHVLSYDPSNAYALLLWAYVDHYLMGNSDDDFYDKLCMAHSDDWEIMSMLELAKARYFELRDSKKCEEALKKSIEYCSTHAMNFYMLGKMYVKQGKIKEGNLLIEHGLQNIQRLRRCQDVDTWQLDYVSIQGLLDEFFSGISTNEIAIGGW
ncbi:MAG: hypothetical protein NT124_00975 [Candidatus Dependentiae bacterium]|nr:hypothetical protein [Candidatus Dependentiae bacterium]